MVSINGLNLSQATSCSGRISFMLTMIPLAIVAYDLINATDWMEGFVPSYEQLLFYMDQMISFRRSVVGYWRYRSKWCCTRFVAWTQIPALVSHVIRPDVKFIWFLITNTLVNPNCCSKHKQHIWQAKNKVSRLKTVSMDKHLGYHSEFYFVVERQSSKK
jgi:hypothetical protein